MKIDIETVLRYPMESDDWVKTVAIGGVATLFSIFIIPYFLVAGYLVRAIRAGMDGAEEPPVFDEWGTLLKEGLVAGVIGLIYQIIPILVVGFLVGGSILAIATGSDAGAGIGVLGLAGGLFLGGILSVIFGFVGFAGVANYAREGTFGAGFDFGVISTVITSRAYLLTWAYVIVMYIAAIIVVGILNIVPILGGIAGAFVIFYAMIIAGWLWGNGFAEATGPSIDSATDAETAAV